jgi:large subunit ribosomal protein L13
MKTVAAKAGQTERRWYLIDADNQVVGRVAEKAANLLRGKGKALFTPNVDTGDHVIVINAKKAVFTGKKEVQKVYTNYTKFMGGQTIETPKQRRQRRPELLVESAVKGMVPHTRLGRAQLRKLFVYADGQHPHEAQQPEAIKLR